MVLTRSASSPARAPKRSDASDAVASVTKGKKRKVELTEKDPSGPRSKPRKTEKPGSSSTKKKSKQAKSVLQQPFPYELPLAHLSLRTHPYLYRSGRGEQGIFHVRPYKDELLPLWTFKNAERARWSCERLWGMYEGYKKGGDFVGCDMTRKYLQMGFTRSRRYANNKSGRKYTPLKDQRVEDDEDGGSGRAKVVQAEEKTSDQELKARCAGIFKEKLEELKADEAYERLKTEWAARFETSHGGNQSEQTGADWTEFRDGSERWDEQWARQHGFWCEDPTVEAKPVTGVN